ncbi:MAG: hypothetical protein GC191_08315 [Azospirillum sp.]|nr:hypothetical protein [Azospirillum sp.]
MDGLMTYADLAARYGEPQAFDLLLTIERLAHVRDTIGNNILPLDEEARLRRALAALNQTDMAA